MRLLLLAWELENQKARYTHFLLSLYLEPREERVWRESFRGTDMCSLEF